MSTKIAFSLADGTPFTIDGLGVFENGQYELTEDEEVTFAAANGRSIQDAFKSRKDVKVSGQPSNAVKEFLSGQTEEDSAPVVSDSKGAPVADSNSEPGDSAGNSAEGSDQ